MTQAKTDTKSNGIDKVVAEGAALAEKATETMGKGLEAAQDNWAQASEQTADELRKLGDKGNAFVRENPGLAVAGAIGLGVLIGAAIRGRQF